MRQKKEKLYVIGNGAYFINSVSSSNVNYNGRETFPATAMVFNSYQRAYYLMKKANSIGYETNGYTNWTVFTLGKDKWSDDEWKKVKAQADAEDMYRF